MQMQENLSIVESSQLFTDWKKDNSESYLAHIFYMVSEDNWQFGYYNPDDTITTFTLKEGEVEEIPSQEIFKSDDHKLDALDLSVVKLDFSDAMQKAQALREEKYAKHPAMKQFVILQVIDKVLVYNVTIVTQTFHTINIHINALDGEIVEEKLISLMDIASFEKGSKPDYVG